MSSDGGPASQNTAANPTAGTADGRSPWEWQTRFPKEAWKQIKWEAIYLAICFALFGIATALAATYAPNQLNVDLLCETDVADPKKVNCDQFIFAKAWLACYFAGSLGATVLTIKWLFHSVGTGKWHQDRIVWRIFVPWIGGVYAVMIQGLTSSGLIGSQTVTNSINLVSVISLAFLVGLFSDGVSGMLTNVANAVFGTVIEKK
jgi:hypothetical protein